MGGLTLKIISRSLTTSWKESRWLILPRVSRWTMVTM
jgi:hypothetical protein